ncbi:MAG: alkaline phosphatase family protein [Gemmatimonadales bacterium]
MTLTRDRRLMLLDLAVGVSLANLCLLRVWTEILSLSGPNGYYLKLSPAAPWAVIANVLLLGALFAGVAILVRRVEHPRLRAVARWLFLLTLFIPLETLRTEFHLPRLAEFAFWVVEPAGRPFPLKNLSPLLPLVLFASWPARSARYARAVLLFFAPFTLVTVGRGLWLGATYPIAATFADRPLAPPLRPPARSSTSSSISPRVIILVFDELDQRLAFDDRPAGLELPELERLRGEGGRLYASQATPPSWQTGISLPALITGQAIETAAPAGAAELRLRRVGAAVGDVRDWSREPNLFGRARDLGINAGLVGWYHPYCRVVAAALTRCHWEPYFDVIGQDGRATLGGTMVAQLRSLSPWDRRRRHVESYRRILAQATAAATDAELGLVFVHWPVPHHPYIYDGARGRLTLHHYSHTGYADQLRLVDRTVGELRRALEVADLWERTTIVLTSDHAARVKDQPDQGIRRDERVPFLLKLGGMESSPGVVYDRAFSTLALGDWVLAVLRGDVATVPQAVRWLDQHAGPQPVLRGR